ncbi:MAG: WYL domain-containing protein [Planctomycetota bacterium]|nr:WYL domain-containing protein [Planctomycetota bacterium]
MSDTTSLLRQWTLLKTLSARRYGATVKELADETEVSIRTIRRDLETIARLGFPLEETVTEHGRKHWKLLDGNAGEALGFNLTEAVSLYLGRRFLEPLAGTLFWEGAQSAFRKIRARLGETALNYLETIAEAFHQTSMGYGDYSQKAEIIDGLMIGIEDKRVTRISYQSARLKEPAAYELHPYGIVFHAGSLYLVAFVPSYDEIRHFKIDRMQDVDVQSASFARPQPFDLRSYLAESFGVHRTDGPVTHVKISFINWAARYVAESQWHSSQQLTELPDDSLIAEFKLRDTRELKRWLLSFGPNARVLEPPELIEDLVLDLSAMLTQYTNS